MARKIDEWIGKTDDTAVPPRVKLRILGACNGRCVCCERHTGPALPPRFDHIVPLKDGGENREGNLQVLCVQCHGLKTKGEAKDRAMVHRKISAHYGIKQSKNPMPGSKASPWKKRMDGTVVRRDK